MLGTLVNWEGSEADYGELDSLGTATATVKDGPHNGHTVTVYTEKHNCGAHGERIECSCGEWWQSAMYGCWQWGHQRQEAGDPTLKVLLP